MMLLSRIMVPLAFAAALNAQTDWPAYGHDAGAMRYSLSKQINTGNVSRLQRAWTYHTGELGQRLPEESYARAVAFETTPLVIGNVLYLSTPANRVIALDPDTGKEIWKYNRGGERSRQDPRPRASRRGVLAGRPADAAANPVWNARWHAYRAQRQDRPASSRL